MKLELDKPEKLFTSFLLLFSASVYLYTMGYLKALEIPESPDFTDAIISFVSVLFSRSELVLPTAVASILALLKIIVWIVVGVLILYFVVRWSRRFLSLDSRFPRDENIVLFLKRQSLLMAFAIVGCVVGIISGTIALFAMMVIGPPLATMAMGFYFATFGENKTREKKHVYMIIFLTTCVALSWFGPYIIGHLIGNYTNLSSSFPRAWSGSEYIATFDRQVWRFESKSYWYNCERNRVYGITNDGHIFYSRPIKDSRVRKRVCGE